MLFSAFAQFFVSFLVQSSVGFKTFLFHFFFSLNFAFLCVSPESKDVYRGNTRVINDGKLMVPALWPLFRGNEFAVQPLNDSLCYSNELIVQPQHHES